MSTPRIRTDLQATPTEEGGIKYFDVSDPKSGARMRMYDFEWLIAERMDGRRAFDEVASWARERLGIQPTASDLENYAQRLGELGFFELDAESLRGGNGHNAGSTADEELDITAEAPPIGATAVPVAVSEKEPSA